MAKTAAEKLGIKPEHTIYPVNPPGDYVALIGGLPPGAAVVGEKALPADVVHLEQASHHPEITGITSIPRAYSETEGNAWLDRQHAQQEQRTGISLAIADTRTGQALGYVGVNGLVWRHLRGALGYWVAPTTTARNASWNATASGPKASCAPTTRRFHRSGGGRGAPVSGRSMRASLTGCPVPSPWSGALGERDLAPQDWQRLATIISLAAAAVSLLAYLFGGYVAGRLGGRDGLHHGLRVFGLAVVLLGLLGLLGLSMLGPASIGAGLHSPGGSPSPGEGIRFGDVAVKAATWSLTTMLLGSLAGGVLGERAHRRRHHGDSERAQSSGHGST